MRFPHLGIRVAYDGSDFSGFQRQTQRRSIQAEIERAWRPLFGQHLKIQFSSRTDAGVHCLDQLVMIQNGEELFKLLPLRTQKALLISMNALLPPSIRAWKVFRLREDFNPKSGPLWKEYCYTIINGPSEDPLLRSRALWIRRDLDLRRMRASARKLVGTHDFAAFATRASRYEDKTVRRIISAKILETPHPRFEDARVIELIFRGEGFLHNMVRTMAGTLVEIGLGEDHEISKILSGRSRIHAGVNAPPHPLALHRIELPASVLMPLL